MNSFRSFQKLLINDILVKYSALNIEKRTQNYFTFQIFRVFFSFTVRFN